MIMKKIPKEELFGFLKVFAFCFAIVFLAINAGTIKRIFDYKIVYGGAAAIQVQSEIPDIAEVASLAERPDSIEIPKISITAPLVFIDSAEKSVFSAALDRGVVHYPESALPGEDGQIIFLGHSAPLGWPKIKHDWVFSDLNDLISGDEVIIYFQNQEYRYHVQGKVILDKGEDLPQGFSQGLILLTCWPPGADQRRMAVMAN